MRRSYAPDVLCIGRRVTVCDTAQHPTSFKHGVIVVADFDEHRLTRLVVRIKQEGSTEDLDVTNLHIHSTSGFTGCSTDQYITFIPFDEIRAVEDLPAAARSG